MKSVVNLRPDINSCFFLKDVLPSSCYKTVIWDEDDPQYVFVPELIFNRKSIIKELYKFYKHNSCILIYTGAELCYPDMNIFDYAISDDPSFKCRDRVMHLPRMYRNREYVKSTENDFTIQQAMNEAKKRKFCNFIYSNPFAHPMRDNLFWEISKYKPVDSLGEHLNNVNRKSDRFENDWMDTVITLKNNYKFTIAAENAYFPGAASEKLIHSFQAHSVPIYFGDPLVENEFNPKAIINVHNYNSFEEVINRIREVDQNDELWAEMVCQPWQTKKQMENDRVGIAKYKEWMTHIFTQDIEKAKRRPVGTFTDLYYQKWFFSGRQNDLLLRGANYLTRKMKNRGKTRQ